MAVMVFRIFRTRTEQEILDRLPPLPPLPEMDAEKMRKEDNAAARIVLMVGVFLRLVFLALFWLSCLGHMKCGTNTTILMSFAAVDALFLLYLLRRRFGKNPLPKAARVMYLIPIAFDLFFFVVSGAATKFFLKLLG